METNQITHATIGAAMAVHRALGPGLLESVYEACLAIELHDRGITFERQRSVPIVYKGRDVGSGYRVDLVVEGSVLVEVKAVARLDGIFMAQILTYMKLLGIHVGLLINFNQKFLLDGVRRVVNEYEPPAPRHSTADD